MYKESMKALYNEYRSKELRREIVTLVPARPELEFPKAQSMKKAFHTPYRPD